MGYHAYAGYNTSIHPRLIAVHGLQWQVISSERIEPGADLQAAMAAAIARMVAEGWQPEDQPRFGFVFVRNGDERRLLSLTPKDPHDTTPTSFNPLR
jgi:hypothetical protein